MATIGGMDGNTPIGINVGQALVGICCCFGLFVVLTIAGTVWAIEYMKRKKP